MSIKYSPLKVTDPTLAAAQTSTNRFAPGAVSTAPSQNGMQRQFADLQKRVQQGDPAAIAQVMQLAQPELDKTDDPAANEARKIANTYLGTNLKNRWEDTSVLHDLLPGIAAAGGALALGLIAPGVGAGAAGAGGGSGIVAAPAFPAAAAGSAPGAIAGLGGTAAAGAGAGAAAAAGTGLSGLLGKAGKWATGHPGLIVGTLGAIDAAHQQQHSNQLAENAVNNATADWNSRKPLRDALLQKLLAPEPGLPSLPGGMGGANPYASRPVLPPATLPVPAPRPAPALPSTLPFANAVAPGLRVGT